MHVLEKSLWQQVKGCESGATLIIRNRRDEDLPSSKSGTLRMQRMAHIPKTFGKKQEKGRKLAFTSYLQSPSALKHALYVVGQHFFSTSGVALATCLIWENGENCRPSPFLYSHSLVVECVHSCSGKVALQMRKVKLMEGKVMCSESRGQNIKLGSKRGSVAHTSCLVSRGPVGCV